MTPKSWRQFPVIHTSAPTMSYTQTVGRGNERGLCMLCWSPSLPGEGTQPNTIGAVSRLFEDGVTCRGQKITVKDDEYTSTPCPCS